MIHPDIVGCDVSKHALDLFDAGVSERIDNTPAACAALAARLCGRFVVFEATGGYDRALRAALDAAGVAFARVNPGRARDFARAAGFLAKTDKVDARMLAAFGQALEPAADARPDPARERLADLVKRRDQLVKMRAQERVRRSEAGVEALRNDIEAHLAWLDARIARFDDEIATVCKSAAPLKQTITRLKSAPGVGQVTATVLVALMPELGRRAPKTIAALAGLAPRARGALHGGDLGHPLKRALWRLLPPPARGRQSAKAGHHRRGPQAHRQPQRHGPRQCRSRRIEHSCRITPSACPE